METGNSAINTDKDSNEFQRIDSSFDADLSYRYLLGLIISNEALKAIVYDPENSSFLATLHAKFDPEKETSIELEKCLNSIPWLKQSYKDVKVGIANDYATLIPESVYNSEILEEVFQLNFGKPENWEVTSDKLLNAEARQIFGFPNWIRNTLEKQFETVSIYHCSSPVFEFLLGRQQGNPDTNVHLDLNLPYLSICVIKDGKIQLANTLKFTTLSELVYQVLYAFKKLALNPEETMLCLSGDVRHADAAFNELYRFVRHVEFIQDENESQWAESLRSLDKHNVFNLTRLLRCEL